MKANDAFPTNFLKAEDLRGKKVTLTIESVEMEKLGNDEKPCVSFRGTTRRLALNKTNFTTIAELTGEDDSDNWTGKKITLYPAKTMYQGRSVACIRIYDRADDTQPEPEPEEPPLGHADLEDDDVPF